MKMKLLLLGLGIMLFINGCSTVCTSSNQKEDENIEYEFHMTNAFGSGFELDLENRFIMTGENVEVRGIPDSHAGVNRVLSYQMVDVYAAAYVQEGEWVLIGFNAIDAEHDNIGWVRVDDLMEYNEENYHLLRYPVTIKEGCVDFKNGTLIKWNGPFWVTYMDGYAEISEEGGLFHNVEPDQIIYPPFEK